MKNIYFLQVRFISWFEFTFRLAGVVSLLQIRYPFNIQEGIARPDRRIC